MINWIPNKTFSGVLEGKSNEITLFYINYDGSLPKSHDPSNRYRLMCKLPGYKSDFGLHESQEIAQVKAEKILKNWLASANFSQN